MNSALSQLVVTVTTGTEVYVDSGIGVNVGVPADGAEVALPAEDKVGVLFAESCAWTVRAAAVKTALGSGWLGLLDGRLQASIAPMITMIVKAR